MINNQKVLSVSNFSVSFPALNTHAVRGLSFDLYRGRSLAIVGESGSGKSITALALMGLLPPGSRVSGSLIVQDGHIELMGLNARSWQQIRGKRISIIFQEPMTALNPVQTVGEQIREIIRQHQKTGRTAARKLALEWMEKVHLAPDLYQRYPHELSGGQKQRIVIAMAMANRPDILIADEPTTALDASVQKEIIELMRALQRENGTALFFITHDLAVAAGIADEFMVLRNGECLEYGPADSLLTRPQHPYTKALLHCRPSRRSKGYRLPTVSDFETGTETMPALETRAIDERIILKLQAVSVSFAIKKAWYSRTRFTHAVQAVSFHIRKGETLGLVGASGCGKSSLGKAIMGLVPISSGLIHIEGKAPDPKGFRKIVQLVFQDPYASLDPLFRVSDIIEEPLRVHGLGNQEQRSQRVRQLLREVGLPPESLHKYPHEFSGGQRQRISIARALALEPQVLICDESVSALDISIQAQVLNLLKELQIRHGLSYLFITHDLSVVHYMSDRILVMDKGRIVESGSPDEILLRPQHPYTRDLIAAMPEGVF